MMHFGMQDKITVLQYLSATCGTCGFIPVKYKNVFILTVDMKQWSRFSSEKRTPSLMKTALALRMKEKNRFMWM